MASNFILIFPFKLFIFTQTKTMANSQFKIRIPAYLREFLNKIIDEISSIMSDNHETLVRNELPEYITVATFTHASTPQQIYSHWGWSQINPYCRYDMAIQNLVNSGQGIMLRFKISHSLLCAISEGLDRSQDATSQSMHNEQGEIITTFNISIGQSKDHRISNQVFEYIRDYVKSFDLETSITHLDLHVATHTGNILKFGFYQGFLKLFTERDLENLQHKLQEERGKSMRVSRSIVTATQDTRILAAPMNERDDDNQLVSLQNTFHSLQGQLEQVQDQIRILSLPPDERNQPPPPPPALGAGGAAAGAAVRAAGDLEAAVRAAVSAAVGGVGDVGLEDPERIQTTADIT